MLSKGDKVKVIQGDLINVTGSVVAVEKEGVRVKPNIKGFKDNIMLSMDELVKHFEPGNHIAVISGKYSGERGVITKVDGEYCYFFSHMQKAEKRVFTNDLKLSSQVAEISTNAIEHEYDVHDLVSYQYQ